MGVSARIGKRGMSIDKDLRAAEIFRRFFGEGKVGHVWAGLQSGGRCCWLDGAKG